MLTPPLQALMHERGWLRMLAPKSAGGGELALPDVVRLEEALAAVDGSTAWTVTLCAGAGWFAGFLPPEFAREIIGTPRLCVGGSGAPTGHADAEGEGYRLSGTWQFATGAPIATHFTMNAVIREGGQAVLDCTGAPLVRAFIIPAKDVRVHDTWRSIGLRASASHSFSVDNVWVDGRHAFVIDPAAATAPGPLYRFPFVSLAYVTIAANIAGMGAHFQQLARALIANRKRPGTGVPLSDMPEVSAALLRAQRNLEQARELFYGLLERMWDTVCQNDVVSPERMHELHRASLDLVVTARRGADDLYPYCGLYAAHEESEINRVWRDVHTGTQHTMLLPLSPSF